MTESDERFTIAALEATIVWQVPTPAIAWVRDDVCRRLLSDLDAAEPSVVWRQDPDAWRSVAMGDHMSAPSPADLLPETFIAINRTAAASVASDHLVLHAGVVAVDTEIGPRALAWCGTSGAGKSTATAAAALRGHAFVADEVCALQPEGWWVRPYLRPIGLRPGGAAALGVETRGPFDQPGAPSRVWHAPTVVDAPVQLGMVALVDRRPGPTQIVVHHPAAALELLVNHTLATDGRTRAMFRRAEQLVRAVPVVQVSYEDVFDAVDQLARRLGDLS